jgi:glycine cleavage system H lipoate-binding protein
VIADPDMDKATRADMQQWTGCIAGALTLGQFEAALADAGLLDLEIRETHRVHEHAASAIVRARKPRRPGSVRRRGHLRGAVSIVFHLPSSVHYSPERHVWARPDEDGFVTIGVAAPLREVLWHAPDVEFWAVDRVEVGSPLATAQARHGRRIAIGSPVAGTLVEVNELLEVAPQALSRPSAFAGVLL